MRTRNPFLIYDVGNVVVLLDGEVTEESVYNTATSTGCHRSSVAVLPFFSNRKRLMLLEFYCLTHCLQLQKPMERHQRGRRHLTIFSCYSNTVKCTPVKILAI